MVGINFVSLYIMRSSTFFIFIFSACFHVSLYGQGDSNQYKNLKPEFRRQLNHDYIDREQKAFEAYKQAANTSITKETVFYINQAVQNKADEIQYNIEKDSILDHRLKVQYLHGLSNMLRYINNNRRSTSFKVSYIPATISAYEQLIALDRSNETILPAIVDMPYEVGNAVMQANIFDQNEGYDESRYVLIKKYVSLYPEKTLQTLLENPNIPFLDSLVKVAAYQNPRQLYDYAAANNRLGFAIRKIDDPLVKTVSKMATSGGSGQLYFPFLDNIMSGKISFKDVDDVKNDEVKYYQLLVKTHIDYVNRQLKGEAIQESASIMEMMQKKAISSFVNVINGLHNSPDPVRFRVLQPLSAQELYYVAVLSDGIIYTSSYTNGVYPYIMSRIGQRGDSLLMSVKFDKYRKFIKIAAGYNTLSHFLASFKRQADAAKLMQAFVGGLEKSEGLEDGVDVADSYASIAESIKPLADEMIKNIQINYQRNVAQNNKRGMVIYNLLEKLFQSADSTNKINLSTELGISPVYNVNFKTLTNEENKVIMQVFFYGDEDGQNIFQGFLRQFSNSNWKTTHTDKWVYIQSVKGKPVMIYANKPLPEETGEDEKAQRELEAYLAKNNLAPTVVIHRGHSYYANYTINQILPSAKIVFMGSCGGYHLIHDILQNAPDAHIIASKQIGKTRINQPFFNLLMEKLRNGQDIDWIPFWKELDKSVTVEGLEDYIPPYKNLGAIFIKAYKTAMDTEQIL